MSVTVRLARFGKRNAPSYKIVVAKTRGKRNGKFLDILGYFNPSKTPAEFEIDKEKYTEWRNKGALTTTAVEKLIEGTYKYVKYNPKAQKADEKAAGSDGQVQAEETTKEE